MTPGLIERLEAAGEHTPGPWRAEHTGYYWHVVSSEGAVTDVCPSQFIGGGTIENPSPREPANARLIAAAPDLLDALIEALPYVESCEYDNGYKPGAVAKVVRNMNAAILKARATQE